MHVVEIVVRFGDTILEVARVAAGGSYRIGTERDVDLAVEVAGMRSFPLVGTRGDRFVVRRPAGLPARVGERSLADDETEVVPRLAEPITLIVGRLAIEVTLIAPAARIDRPRFAARGAPFALASLFAHLAFLWIADALASPEPPTVRAASAPSPRPTPIAPAEEPPVVIVKRVARKKKMPATAAPQAAVAPTPPVEPAAPAASDAPPAQRRARAIESARTGGILGAETRRAVESLAAVTGVGNKLDDVGPIYREHEAEASGFGGSQRKFDPTADPRFDSVKTGRYETVAAGRAAGEYHDVPGAVATKQPPHVELATQPAGVRAVLATRIAAMTTCYERATERAFGSLTVAFEIGEDGKVRHAEGRGLGEIATCVAAVVARTRFDATRSTKATLSLAFQRP